MLSQQQIREISQIKRRRNGKKYAITKLITEINQIIMQRGSRTKLNYLKESLKDLLNLAISQHEKLMLHLDETDPEFNDEWIDDLSLRVTNCSADICNYLTDRQNDAPSESFSEYVNKKHIQAWRETNKQCSDTESLSNTEISLPDVAIVTPSECGEVTNMLSKMYIEPGDSVSQTNLHSYGNHAEKRRSRSMPELNVQTQFDNRPLTLYQTKSNANYYFKTSEIKTKKKPHFEKAEKQEESCSQFLNQTSNDLNQTKFESYSRKKVPKFPNNLNQTKLEKYSDGKVLNFPNFQSTYIKEPMKNLSTAIHDIDLNTKEKMQATQRAGEFSQMQATQRAGEFSQMQAAQRAGDFSQTQNTQRAGDYWIDELDMHNVIITPKNEPVNIQMQMLIQQRLPPQTILSFDGSAHKWVEFITCFHDMIHSQPYLTTFQKHTYLLQNLKGQAKKSVEGFAKNAQGYIMTLKKLKYMFGNAPLVAKATLKKITSTKKLPEHDIEALTDYYYSLSSCINTLEKMDYIADIYSSDVLRQALSKLPDNLIRKWSEHSFKLRKNREPSLRDLEMWLQDRVMASKDPYLPERKSSRSNFNGMNSNQLLPKYKRNCAVCKKDHRVYQCNEFKEKSSTEKLKCVKTMNLCFNCLQPKHQVKLCPSKNKCSKEGCNKKHHTSLHEALSRNVERQIQKEEYIDQQPIQTKSGCSKPKQVSDQTDISSKSVVLSTMWNKKVHLKIVPVKVFDIDNKPITTYAFLDDGSQCTIIKESLYKRLNIPGETHKMNLGTIKDNENITAKSINLKIASLDDTFTTNIENVYSISNSKFKVPGRYLPKNHIKDKEWNFIKGLGISKVCSEEIDLLIGADVPSVLFATEVKYGNPELPCAVKTPLGWTLFGVQKNENLPESGLTSCGHLSNESNIENLLQKFWDTESFGTKVNAEISMSIKDQEAVTLLDQETKFENGHYVVPMIWRKPILLPDNLYVANKRFDHLLNRFRRDESYFKMYSKNITDYLQERYARKLTPSEINQKSEKTWYLPHHGVLNENKPGKVQMVFDAASKANGRSLNDNLFTGPDLLNSLVGILLRFRAYPIAIVGDIKGMYYQVRLKPSDTDAVRFLWKDDPKSKEPPDHYQMLVHIFGAADSPCCANYALRRAALDQKSEFSENVVNTVLRSFYMDDLLTSTKTVKEAKTMVHDLIKLFENKGFKLAKFKSNSNEVLKSIPDEDKTVGSTVTFDKPEITRALGVKWNLQSDCFFYTTLTKENEPTKRGILKTSSTIFDPLGFLTPFVLRAKIILQELWKTKVDWDEPIDQVSRGIWEQWLLDLQKITCIQIPRHINVNENFDIQLHLFCDASEKAFAAAAYVRIDTGIDVSCHLLMSKSRVAPLKQLTLPRLELQGAVLAIRLKETLLKECDIKFSQINFWTDSMLNLQYIHNEEKRFKIFVANRVAEIREYSNPKQWRHVNGKVNPADLATRGVNIEELSSNSLWFKGPWFLYQSQECWEEQIENYPVLDHDDVEIRKETVTVHTIETKQVFINFTRYSKWYRLVRMFSWIYRFLNNCKQKSTDNLKHAQLSIPEELNGRNVLLKLVQAEIFSKEIDLIKTNQSHKLKGPLMKLDPFIGNDGLLRVGGRLKKSDVPYAAKHQVILPSHHHVVKLLIKHYHEKNHHIGQEQLLSFLRQEYWICRGRATVKSVIHNCIGCRKRNARVVQPKMSDLPHDRLSIASPPFHNTGVDFFGPIEVKILRSRTKRWGCLFTCMVTRAIHLEVAPSLNTDDFLNTLERFMNRRGVPSIMRSDCGTNFKGANNELQRQLQLMNKLKIEENAKSKNMQWIFNTPEAPHTGGAWERLIRSVKTTMDVILAGQVVNDFVLMTVFTEIEALVNSRPLTYVSDDINDLQPLTPNHFLLGRASTNMPSCVVFEGETTFKQRWRQVQAITNQFWDRWQKEYLPSLTQRVKWFKDTEQVKVGDIILLLDEKCTRGNWRLGRIVETLPGHDGVVRTVKVKTSNGAVYLRSTRKIAPLELC